MVARQQAGQELFELHFETIEAAIHGVARHNRLTTEESQELYSQVMLKIVENDYAVLQEFRRRARWKTYLRVVAQRVLLDDRVREWGRWRPSALARRLGPEAVELDRRINRDNLRPEQAIREISTRRNGRTRAELEELAGRLPRRSRRRVVNDELRLSELEAEGSADERVEAAELQGTTGRLRRALTEAVCSLDGTDRQLLHLRFGRGWTVQRIAGSQNLPARPLYRRFERSLRQLRRHLRGSGIEWREIAEVLGHPETDLELDLQEPGLSRP